MLVSATGGLYLLEGRSVRKLLGGSRYGITWSPDEMYLAARTHPYGYILEWSTGETVPFPAPIHDVHQIYWFGGVLYATHTAANRLETWDGESFGTVQWCGDSSDEHINSIWCDGERFYVCEHRRGIEPARVRVFDSQWRAVGVEEFFGLNPAHACGIHNVYVEDGVLYTLSVDRLVARNLANGGTETTILKDARPGYLRGFARSDGQFIVGRSEVGERGTRGEGDAEILFLDGDLRLEDAVVLPDAGQLHDIRLLEGDRAHNGLDCPVRSSLTDGCVS